MARDFVSHTAVGIAGNGISAAVSLAYVSLLGHRLSPAEYGVVIAALSACYVLTLLLNPLESGISKLAAGFHGLGQPGGLNGLAFVGLRKVAIPCALLLLSWWPLTYAVRPWLHMEVGPLMWLGALWVVSVPASIVRGVLRGDHRFLDASFAQIVDSVARLAVGLAAIHLGVRATGALAGYVAGVGAATLFALWQLRDVRSSPPLEVDPRDVWSSSLPLASVFFFLAFTVNVDVLAAKHYLSPDSAGVYGAAATLVRMIYLGATPMYQVLFSHVAARHAQNRQSRRLTWVVAASLAALLLGSLAIPLLAGDRVLGLVFGAAYVGGAPALRVMWLTTSLLVLEALAAHALIAANRTRGAWAFLLPCLLMLGLLWRYHADIMQIAMCSLVSVALGGVVLLIMESSRTP